MSVEQEEEILPLVEERVRLGKRVVMTGRVRVRTRTEDVRTLVREQLAQENVEIRRVAVNEDVDAPPPVREEGDTVIVPVVEEVLVLHKQLVLVEEIHLTRRRTMVPFEEEVTLSRQVADVERDPAAPQAPEDPSSQDIRRNMP